MSKYYLIIEKSGSHHSIVNSLSSRSGINDDLIFNQDIKDQLIYNVKSSFEVLPLAAHIFTRRGDYQKAPHETNKLWSSLTTYQYLSFSYEDLVSLPDEGNVDLKPYLITEEQFLDEMKSSDTMKSVLEMNSLTERLPREEVVLEVIKGENKWCYVTDFLHEEDSEGKTTFLITIPLHIGTDSVKDYITERVGVEYEFNF